MTAFSRLCRGRYVAGAEQQLRLRKMWRRISSSTVTVGLLSDTGLSYWDLRVRLSTYEK